MITKLYNRLCRGLLYCGVVAVFTACTDTWDDHYDGVATGVQEGTLWQAIKQNGQLTNFAKVIQACGYDRSLDGSQVFTVFAPTDDQFTSAEAEALISSYNAQKGTVNDDDNTVIKEFLQNHIALYNYSVSPSSNDTITLMNGKYAPLTANKIGNASLVTKNSLYGNGVLFTVGSKLDYLPNVFEYLRKDADLDSVASFFYSSRFYRREFQANKSVAGGIVDGKTVYLDSVFTQVNELFDDEFLSAKLNKEDSLYWMVVPTNDMWSQLYAAYAPCFVYDSSEADADSLAYTNSRLAIVKGTIFSRSLNTDAALADSAFSTDAVHPLNRSYNWGASVFHYYQYGDGTGYSLQKPLQPGGVLYGTQNVTCSNGQVMKAGVGNWNFSPLNTFFRPIIIEAEGQGSIQSVSRKINSRTHEIEDAVVPTTRLVPTENSFRGKVWNNCFVEFRQLYSQNDSATFNIRNVLSNVGYDIYLVFAPALAYDKDATDTERLPVKLNTTLITTDADGKTKEKKLAQGLVTTPDEVNYLQVAEDCKFDYCTYGLSSSGDSKLTLRVETNVRPSEFNKGTYSRVLRIDCILLVPHGMAYDKEEAFGIMAHGDGVVYAKAKK